jgi:glutamine synthetase
VTVGVDTLPPLPKDNTDRNRTSPFAFTGNKFEFRMVGSSASISGPNIVINTIVAEALDEFATRLEKASDKIAEAGLIIKETINKHERIIFNGNNYSDDWVKEAEKRGLPNITSTVAALKTLLKPDVVTMFEKYKVLSKSELHSRVDIYLEQYTKQVNIEAKTALNMAHKQYLPAVIEFVTMLSGSVSAVKAVGVSAKVQESLLTRVNGLLESASAKVETLEANLLKAQGIGDVAAQAEAFRDTVFAQNQVLRQDIDALESLVSSDYWPVPSYEDLLFRL